MVAAFGIWMVARPSSRETAACPEGATLIGQVWSPAQERALAARGAGGASTAAALTRFSQSWARAHDEGCAARAKGELPAIELDRRDRCLELARAQLAALAPRLIAFDEVGLVRGAAVVESLTSPASCLAQRGAVDDLLPEDLALRTIVQAQRAELGLANAFAQGGQHAEASAVLARLKEVAYPPLATEIADVRADLANMRGEDKAKVLALYDDAVAKATASGNELVEIGALLDRAFHLDNHDEAARSRGDHDAADRRRVRRPCAEGPAPQAAGARPRPGE